jgi:hypothetical protein
MKGEEFASRNTRLTQTKSFRIREATDSSKFVVLTSKYSSLQTSRIMCEIFSRSWEAVSRKKIQKAAEQLKCWRRYFMCVIVKGTSKSNDPNYEYNPLFSSRVPPYMWYYYGLVAWYDFICGLFHGAINSLGCIVSNNRMISEQRMKWNGCGRKWSWLSVRYNAGIFLDVQRKVTENIKIFCLHCRWEGFMSRWDGLKWPDVHSMFHDYRFRHSRHMEEWMYRTTYSWPSR